MHAEMMTKVRIQRISLQLKNQGKKKSHLQSRADVHLDRTKSELLDSGV